MVVFEAFGSSQTSTTKEGLSSNSSVYYGEHFHFQKKVKKSIDIENEILKVTIYDDGILDSKIGSTSVSIPTVYYRKNHVVEHEWHILINNEVDISTPAGFFKLSVNITKDDEKMMDLKPESPLSKASGNTDQVGISIPPHLKLKKHTVKITIFALDKLVGMDSAFLGMGELKSSDPYIIAKLGQD